MKTRFLCSALAVQILLSIAVSFISYRADPSLLLLLSASVSNILIVLACYLIAKLSIHTRQFFPLALGVLLLSMCIDLVSMMFQYSNTLYFSLFFVQYAGWAIITYYLIPIRHYALVSPVIFLSIFIAVPQIIPSLIDYILYTQDLRIMTIV